MTICLTCHSYSCLIFVMLSEKADIYGQRRPGMVRIGAALGGTGRHWAAIGSIGRQWAPLIGMGRQETMRCTR